MIRKLDMRIIFVLTGVVLAAFFIGWAVYYQQKKVLSVDDGIVYTVPPLPYSYSALEPYIDAKTMKLHHDEHHQAYVNNLNAALADYPAIKKRPLKKLLKNLDALPHEIRQKIQDNGGGHENHSFFWLVMTSDSTKEPIGKVRDLLVKTFGSFEDFKKRFNQAALNVFGSGWVWLVLDTQGHLKIMTTSNQDSPLSVGMVPLLGLDVWEHAYYLKYTNKRNDYSTAWWNVVNWYQVDENYRAAILINLHEERAHGRV